MSNPNTVFISYASLDDSGLVRQIAQNLSDNGLHVWVDHALNGGDAWEESLEHALDDASTYVLLLNPKFLTSPRGNFETGVAMGHAARDRNVRLIPVLLPGIQMKDVPRPLQKWSPIDASHTSIKELADKLTEAIAPKKRIA
jgi:hypothetical protein